MHQATAKRSFPETRYMLLPILLLLGAGNAVLRLPGTSISAFYVMAPFAMVWLWLASAGTRSRVAIALAVIFYGWVAGVLHGTPLGDMAAQSAFYLLALSAIEAVLVWKHRDQSFQQNAEFLLDLVAGAAAIICLAQWILRFDLPGTWGYSQYGYVTAFFYTPNDLALFLSAYLIAVLFGGKPLSGKLLILAAVLAINVVNEARAALLVCLVAPLVWLSVPFLSARGFKYPVIVFLAVLTSLGLVGFIAAAMLGIDDTAAAVEGMKRLLLLDPFRLPGSIYNRIDALIFGFTEMANSWWLGLGPGGSVHILSLPQYDTMTAQSLHNAVAELSFDLGPAFYVPFVAIFGKLFVHYAFARRLNLADLGRVAFLLCLPFLSISQSSGFISNYAFWAAAVFIWVRESQEARPSASRTRSDLARLVLLKRHATAIARNLGYRRPQKQRAQP